MSIQDPRYQAFLTPQPFPFNPEDVRHGPLFDSLSERIRLVEREGPTAIVWADVARDAIELLCEQSRDLSAVCWGAVGLARSEGATGLALGLAMVRHMVEAEWDTLFPPTKRMRQRRGSIAWLVTQLARVLPQSPIDPAQGESLRLAATQAAALDRAIGDKMPDAPSMRELLAPLKELAREVDEQQAVATAAAEKQPQAPASEALEQAGSATDVSPAPKALVEDAPKEAVQPDVSAAPVVTAVSRAADTGLPPLAAPELADYDATHDQVVSRCQSTTRALALAFLERNPADWRGYTLLGAVTWLAVDALPATDAQGHTLLMLPSQTRRDDLAAIEAAGNMEELAVALAKVLSASGLFWFDGHFKLSRVLQKLSARDDGKAWKLCAETVTSNARAFVNRMPPIINFSFQDGTPFASELTRGWLAPVMQSAASGVATSREDSEESDAQRARALLTEGDENGAFAVLAECARKAEGERERFKARLLLSRLCLDVGHHIVASAMLDVLKAEAEAQRLSAWEPQIWSELNRQRYRCAVMAPPLMESAAEKAATQALTALALTDPVEAIRLARDREIRKK
ncbi:MAG: type VI secretion system protein TssA [Acetobacter sp.]